jgi:diguanylate cyclase (GGDEF)-like protein
VIITSLRSPDGRLRGFAKITRDITKRRQVELALSIFTARLQRSNDDLQEFAMIASHDLQEPLRKIQMFGDRLQQEFAEPLGPSGQDYIKRMQSAASRGQTLGGDEFLALLAEQTLSSARECMERVSAAVVAIPTVANGGVLIRGVTISVGIAEFRGTPRPETSQLWLKRADAALYRAKSRGKNCVEIAE